MTGASPRDRRTSALVALLAWFAVIAGSAIAAGKLLALAEHPGGATSLDRSITTWVVAHRTGALTTLARTLSVIGSQEVLLPIVAVAAVALLARRRVAAAGLVLAWGGAIGLYNVAKDVVSRPRPPKELWLTTPSSSAFPSGHATQSLATFTALALVVASVSGARGPARALAIVLTLILAAAVGWSRVYLGVHWATDVVGGWLVGAAWVAAVVALGRRHQPQVTPATGRPSSR